MGLQTNAREPIERTRATMLLQSFLDAAPNVRRFDVFVQYGRDGTGYGQYGNPKPLVLKRVALPPLVQLQYLGLAGPMSRL